jgi:hypothetical protein
MPDRSRPRGGPLGQDKVLAVGKRAIVSSMNGASAVSDRRDRQRRWLLCGAMMLAAFGAKLWLIARYSNPTPFWDEWGALLRSVFIPYFNATLSLQDFLSAHNEHRLATSRVPGLLLMLANGLWDPVLQMIFNAAIHVGIGAFVLLVLGRKLDTFGSAVLAVLLTIVIAVPYSWENTLMGMETQFYCVVLFSLLAFYLIAQEGDLSALSILGLIAGVIAFFSVASGALAFLSCLALVVGYRILGLTKGSGPWLLAGLLLLAFVLAIAFTPRLNGINSPGAHSVREFRKAYLWLAGWPFPEHPNFGGLIVNLPWMLLVWRTLRRPPQPGNIVWVLLAFGSWNVLQFVALAYGRASLVWSSRYLDSVTFNVILNFICLATLVGRRWLVQVVWATIIAGGLYTQSGKALSDPQWRLDTALRQEGNVKSFLENGQFPPDASGKNLTLPYPNDEQLKGWLSDPKVRRILPSNLQAAIPKEEVGEDKRYDRLGVLRDGLLRSGPYLAGAGVLLLVMLILGFMLQAGRARWVARPQAVHQ